MIEYVKKSDVLEKQTTMIEYDEGGWDAKVKVVQVSDIESIPLAEVEPVNHGWWKSVGLASLKCSECGFIDDYKMHFKNCPECRAKMDKKG